MHWVMPMLYHTMLLLLWSSLAVLPKILDKDHMPSGCKSFFLDWQEIVVIPLSMFQSWSHPTSLQQVFRGDCLITLQPSTRLQHNQMADVHRNQENRALLPGHHSAVWLIPILDSSSCEWGQVPPGPRHTELAPLPVDCLGSPPCWFPWEVLLQQRPSTSSAYFKMLHFPFIWGGCSESPFLDFLYRNWSWVEGATGTW